MNTHASPVSTVPSPRHFRIRRAVGIILPCLLLCACLPAGAFSGWEHETLSQASLLVAENYADNTLKGTANAAERLPVMRETVRTFYEGLPEPAEARKPGTPFITFGEISMLADYMKDTYDMLHLPQSRVNVPVDARTSNLPFLRTMFGQGGKIVSLASASHDAYSHFQGRVLDAFSSNHKLAIAAACQTNLWGALMLSAYANHFLQDSFAAGHLLTPRDSHAHDLDVAMLHDDFNDHGLTYVITQPRQLLPLAESARNWVGPSVWRWPSQDGKPAHTLSYSYEALNTFSTRLSSESTIEVLCYGDDKMNSTDLQSAMMLIYCARAVADVIESYVSGSPVNSFPDYIWDRRNLGTVRGIELIDMRMPYGGLTCNNRIPSAKLVQAAEKLVGGDPSATNYNVVASLTRSIYRNPGLALTFGFESVSDFDGSHMRGLLEAEGLVIGGRRDLSRSSPYLKEHSFARSLWPQSWGLTVGYSGLYGVDDMGQGAFARVVWPIAALNLQISAQAGARYIWGDGVEGLRDFEMLRVDWGLHVLTIFVGVGHDYYSRRNLDLTDGLCFEAGISIALPYSKFKNIGAMAE